LASFVIAVFLAFLQFVPELRLQLLLTPFLSKPLDVSANLNPVAFLLSRNSERRREWIEHGFTPSDFSEEYPSEEEDGGADPWDWGQDDDMNYSAHS
jgi:hypothetical protein